MVIEDPEIDSPSGLLGVRSRMRFNGRLDVQNADGLQWSLYLYMGRIIWATGGAHPGRRWHRTMARYCPQLDLSTFAVCETDGGACWDYYRLTVLAKRQLITGEQAVAIVRITSAEVLFDILQQEETKPVCFNSNPQDILETSLAPLNADHLLEEIQQDWAAWRNLGLADQLPDLAPVLRRSEQLQQEANEKVYRVLTATVDGKRTLRDLAALMKQDLLPLARLLLPFLRKGLIGLTPVPDLPVNLPIVSATPSSDSSFPVSTSSKVAANIPLIACIDDSARERQIMEQIVTQAGYRFLGIQDSVQALPLLLEQKPNLIFLDLVMPIANGYEICAQIRRVSAFKDIPVVILTSNDGSIDRVRAKVVGSSGFIPKPVDAEKVRAITRKFLNSVGSP